MAPSSSSPPPADSPGDGRPDHPGGGQGGAYGNVRGDEEGGGEGLAPPPVGTLREDPAEQVRDLIVPAAQSGPRKVVWSELLDAADARELMGRLAKGDPLGLRNLCVEHLRARHLALHADRLHIRCLALAAFKGLLYAGRPPLDVWLRGLVAQGATELVREDLEFEIENRPVHPDDEVSYRFLTEVFGVEPPLARRVGVRFNLLPNDVRQVLWRAAMEGVPVDRLGDGAAARFRRGLDVLSRAAPLAFSDLADLGGWNQEERP